MQQRSSSSSSSSSSRCLGDEHTVISIDSDQLQQQNPKWRRNADDDFLDDFPVYNHHRNSTGRKVFFRSRLPSPQKWIHAIPVLVLLCLFILWCFSSRVDAVIKDGRITVIRQIDTPLPSDTRIDLTILAVSASSPVPSIRQNLSGEDEIFLNPASSPN